MTMAAEHATAPAPPLLLADVQPPVSHPARYSDSILAVMVEMLRGSRRVLDPFAGTGRIHELAAVLPGCHIVATEIEPEWAAFHPVGAVVGNALHLPFADGTFDAAATSPCYGNRMADHHHARDGSRRLTYRHTLGRPLHPDNAGRLQWGAAYREFHRRAWREAWRVLQSGGRFVLNVKDHVRAGKRQEVTAWHVETLAALGFRLVVRREVETPSLRYGANGDLRVECEVVLLFEKGKEHVR